MKINLHLQGDKMAGKLSSIDDPRLPASDLLLPGQEGVTIKKKPAEKEAEELVFYNDSVEKDDWMKALPGYQDEVKLHEDLEVKHRAKSKIADKLRKRIGKK